MDSTELAQKKQKFFNILSSSQSNVTEKYKAVFELKTIGDEEAADLLVQAFPNLDGSELLKHELVYALGQMRNPKIMPFLLKTLNDEEENPIVRHEAGEGVAYMNDRTYFPELEKYVDCPHEELRDTCRIALKRLEDKDAESYEGLAKYGYTLEPAPGYAKDALKKIIEEKYGASSGDSDEQYIEKVLQYILDPETHLYHKYKGLYYLRDHETVPAVKAMGELLAPEHREKTGALLRHEVCFALGEINERAAVLKERLEQCISDETEKEIVRHEAISAYSSCCNDMDFIRKFNNDSARVVKESAIVATDMIDYWAH